MHIVIDSVLQPRLIVIKGSSHRLSVHQEVKRDDKNNNEHGGQTVTPDVHTLIVNHKQALYDFFSSVEINTISVGDVMIILHVIWSCLIVTNKMRAMRLFSLADSFRRWGFLLILNLSLRYVSLFVLRCHSNE